MPITDWTDAYRNAAYVPEIDTIAARWPDRCASVEARFPPEILHYGSGARQLCHLFRPEGTPGGLVVIVHGGYWLQNAAADFTFLAEGALARGHAVAMPTYTLAPDATIAEITGEVATAIRAVAALIPGPIYLAGHSAGGHLATRMVCVDGLEDRVASRIQHVLSISGVHDLRPLLRTDMADPLHLTPENAAADSPVMAIPRDGLRITCAVGTDERPEFLRQNDLLVNIWSGLGADTRSVHLPGHNHFTIIDGLCAADGFLTKLLLDQEAA